MTPERLPLGAFVRELLDSGLNRLHHAEVVAADEAARARASAEHGAETILRLRNASTPLSKTCNRFEDVRNV